MRVVPGVLGAILITFAQEADRQPVPGESLRKEAHDLVRDLFEDEYRRRTPKAQTELAQKLLNQARDPGNTPATLYVLLEEARGLAVRGGDLSVALEALEETTNRFEVDSLQLRAEVLSAIAKKSRTPDAAGEVARLQLALAQDAVRADNFDLARKALRTVETLSRKSKRVDLLSEARKLGREIALLREKLTRVEKARKTLLEAPDDPEANLAVGEYECFMKGNWALGLPLLAKGKDEELARLAQKELAEAGTPQEVLTLADAWWDLAKTIDTGTRPSLEAHAIDRYKDAWPSLAGLQREKVRKRFESHYSFANAKPAPASGPEGWGYSRTNVALDSTYAHDGVYSVRMIPNPAPKGWSSIVTRPFPCEAGKEYRVSAWVLTGKNEGSDGLFIRWLTPAGQFIGQRGPNVPIDQPWWTPISMTLTAPASAGQCTVSIHMSSKMGVVWMDELSLVKVGEEKELVSNGSFEVLR